MQDNSPNYSQGMPQPSAGQLPQSEPNRIPQPDQTLLQSVRQISNQGQPVAVPIPAGPSQGANPIMQNALSSQLNIENIDSLLQILVDHDGSDLHLTAGYPPIIRIDGDLQHIGGHIMTSDEISKLVYQCLKQNQQELFEVNLEVDVAYSLPDGNRFRINAYHEKSNVAAAFRLIPSKIRTIKELELPEIINEFTKLPQGFVLVTGPTGSGKSTTLAAIIEEINATQNRHIITIEDPIEYIYSSKKSVVDQREIGQDTHAWNIALRSALRQDPNVVLVGEMRDFETIEAALTIAETGHLVFATVHTNSASQSIDRIIDVFPPHQQQQVRIQLSNVLEGIISQRLIPTIGGGRRCALELMLANSAVRALIREGKSYQLDNVIATNLETGMISLERSLVALIREGKITIEQAQMHTTKPDELMKLLKMN